MRDCRMSILTCFEAAKYLDKSALPAVIIPIGPMEEHGPHLPNGIDFLNAEKVALMVAEKSGCLVYPTIPLMCCGISNGCIGTCDISPETLLMLTSDITFKLAKDGFKKILWATGHGGRSVDEVRHGIQYARKLLFIKGIDADFDADCIDHKVGGWWEKIIKETANDGHAGEIETSAVMYLSLELIVGDLPPADFHTVVGSKIVVSHSGINGDPRKATKAKGEVIVNCIVDYLVNWITSPVGSIAA